MRFNSYYLQVKCVQSTYSTIITVILTDIFTLLRTNKSLQIKIKSLLKS